MTKFDTKETLVSIAKTGFSTIPFAGTALTELVFDYNGRVKQNRLNKFIEILAKSITQETDVNIDNIKTEDFSDLFESILKRVVTTKSEEKLNRFKDIIVQELNNPTNETELLDLYLDLITILSEKELFILFEHRHFNSKFQRETNKKRELERELSSILEEQKKENFITENSKVESLEGKLKVEIKELKEKLDPLKKNRKADHYGITNQKFMFHKQRLYSKGLLLDYGIGSIGYKAFEIMSITEFGEEFLGFIMSNN
ncbi:hypothetical protein [Flavobacterium cerinum]|uniref:DUF4393 domain-containing protein n=1 Tax=Flavobacterium cerinum TaxID=2502784 RepID=A0A444HCX1_9FLAO|nr:hypothetical protein [Flavobacterium cerinum]RWX01634.1 hypothetical protein EPI11_06700 [Flavobacterium cerinum]